MWMGKIRSNRLPAPAPSLAPRLAGLGTLLLMPLVAACLSSAQEAARSAGSRALASQEARERVRKVIPAVGLVLVRHGASADAELRPRGSAVVVRRDGLVATNLHVIARDKTDRLYEDIFLSFAVEPGAAATSAPRRYRLKPVIINEARDLALLRVVPEEGQEPPSFTPVELGDAQKLELLDDIVIIGFPEKGGTTVTVNTGVVEGKDALDEWVKTDARLIHGNSGGAAVNGEGKLIGIPTKVVVDSDGKHSYGAVGYLRPAHLVAAMVSRYQEAEQKTVAQVRPEVTTAAPAPSLSPNAGPAPKSGPLVTVRGVVKAADGTPVAGARVGLLRVGQEVSAQSLITWGGSNAEGRFELEKPVPPGRYTLRAKAIGYEAFSLDVEIGAGAEPVVIELRAPSND
jgi:S1-C subfamily serine protease